MTYEDGSRREHAAQRGGIAAYAAGYRAAGYHTVASWRPADRHWRWRRARCIDVEDIAPGERVLGSCGADLWRCAARAIAASATWRASSALAEGGRADKARCSGAQSRTRSVRRRPDHFSPYSPSSRLFYNPLHADARFLFGERALLARAAAGTEARPQTRLEQTRADRLAAIGRVKMCDLPPPLRRFPRDRSRRRSAAARRGFCRIPRSGGQLLDDHARFRSVACACLKPIRAAWNWRDWPAHWRNPRQRGR